MAARKKAADVAAVVEETKPKERKMGFISVPLDDVQEAQPAPEGEYDLKIIKAVEGKSRAGTKMVTITIAFDDTDAGDAGPFMHWLRDPGDIDDDDQKKMAALEAKRFQQVFDLSDDWEADDLVGETGNCFVGQETGDDNVTRNRLRLPRIKE